MLCMMAFITLCSEMEAVPIISKATQGSRNSVSVSRSHVDAYLTVMTVLLTYSARIALHKNEKRNKAIMYLRVQGACLLLSFTCVCFLCFLLGAIIVLKGAVTPQWTLLFIGVVFCSFRAPELGAKSILFGLAFENFVGCAKNCDVQRPQGAPYYDQEHPDDNGEQEKWVSGPVSAKALFFSSRFAESCKFVSGWFTIEWLLAKERTGLARYLTSFFRATFLSPIILCACLVCLIILLPSLFFHGVALIITYFAALVIGGLRGAELIRHSAHWSETVQCVPDEENDFGGCWSVVPQANIDEERERYSIAAGMWINRDEENMGS